ncbi:tyrosine-type recombinase/integrase [Duganella aceris]|uniref:Tyrosine-type recombinase/integrase n=1 Tax=Duganella aceris TaxID=2703883 RepID=A0ABX0FTW8_9BURK|nr:tyrosine-type recombinase/integrase [Duganella aceris]NGZ88146.1 tyrosine-type recombinase/integrase [Duganella aceris]
MKPLNNPTKAWHRILAVAKVGKCRLHDCRHAFASILVNESASLYQVQLLLGHASSVTTQRYAHLVSARCAIRPSLSRISSIRYKQQDKLSGPRHSYAVARFFFLLQSPQASPKNSIQLHSNVIS